MRFPNCAVLIGQYRWVCVVLIGCDRSQSIGQKQKPGLTCGGWLRCLNKQDTVREASFWGSSLHTEYVRSPGQQWSLTLIHQIGALSWPWKSILADKFLLGVNIKWIFLLGVHTCFYIYSNLTFLVKFSFSVSVLWSMYLYS